MWTLLSAARHAAARLASQPHPAFLRQHLPTLALPSPPRQLLASSPSLGPTELATRALRVRGAP